MKAEPTIQATAAWKKALEDAHPDDAARIQKEIQTMTPQPR